MAEQIGPSPAEIESFEASEHPLSFIDVRNWLLALDMPFFQFTPQTHNLFDTTLGRKENIIFPEDEDDSQRYARADPPPHQIPDI